MSTVGGRAGRARISAPQTWVQMQVPPTHPRDADDCVSSLNSPVKWATSPVSGLLGDDLILMCPQLPWLLVPTPFPHTHSPVDCLSVMELSLPCFASLGMSRWPQSPGNLPNVRCPGILPGWLCGLHLEACGRGLRDWAFLSWSGSTMAPRRGWEVRARGSMLRPFCHLCSA